MSHWVFEYKSRAKRRRYYAQCFFHEDDGALTIVRRDLKSGEPVLREGPVALREPVARLLLFFLRNCRRELQIDALCAAVWQGSELRDKPVHLTLRKHIEELRGRLGDDRKELIRLGGPVGTYVFDADATQFSDFDELEPDADFDTGLTPASVLLPDNLFEAPASGENMVLREIMLLRRDGERRTVGFIPEDMISRAALFQLLNRGPNCAALLRWADIGQLSDEGGDTADGLGVLIVRDDRFRAYLGASSVRLKLDWLTDRHVEPGGAVEAVMNNLAQLHPAAGAVQDDSLNRTIVDAVRSFAAGMRGFDMSRPDEDKGRADDPKEGLGWTKGRD